MPTPEEMEQAAGITPASEEDRRRIWAAAQALGALRQQQGPGVDDLRVAQHVLNAAGAISREHLERGLGRATIVLTDSEAAEGEVEIGVEFSPQLDEVGQDEVAGTPAQLLALEVLEAHFGDAQPTGPDEPQ